MSLTGFNRRRREIAEQKAREAELLKKAVAEKHGDPEHNESETAEVSKKSERNAPKRR